MRSEKGGLPFFVVILGVVFLLLGVGFFGISQGPSSSSNQQLLASTESVLQSSFGQIAAFSKPIVPESPELVFLDRTGVKANIPPVTVTPQVLGAIVGGIDTSVSPEVFRYVVELGDTSLSVAEKFGVSLNTVLWANDISSSTILKPGKELIVLPTTGALHLVRPNDTLSEISLWYKGDVKEIVKYNSLASASDIYAGDFVIIPDGIMPKTLPQGRLTPIANSYFIYPIPAPYRVTQGLHAYNAIDFSNRSCGEPVYAAAGGTIQRIGYHSMGGNYVRILHPNGVVTYYGHLARAAMSSGARVFQGEIIGYTGYSGYTIPAGPAGCHVHFEVRGATNPFR
ncbi:peptidoglycan DD-metalloendopeptidase family protein [Patescibacteria group bacterium]|nr:peptidoglycan DD-metalloendopeptidase family protein [Patescibacteria group bacterium]